MNDVLFLEDVNLFDAWDCVDAQTLQRALQSLVVCGRRLMDSLLLSVGSGTTVRRIRDGENSE